MKKSFDDFYGLKETFKDCYNFVYDKAKVHLHQ
jgi:hypothetical protein